MDAKPKWILGSAVNDLFGIFFPGYFGLLLVSLFSNNINAIVVIGLIGLVLIDSGHVYTTFLRGPFFLTHNLYKTVISLLGVFLFLWLLLFFEAPYFWSFIVYFTLFHHVRQYVGLIKWYGKLENYYDPILIQFFYASVIISVMLFHLHPSTITFSYTTEGDILFFPTEKGFNFLLLIQFTIWFLHLLYFGFLEFYKKINPIKTHLFFISVILFYFLVCILNRGSDLVLVPLLFAHGIPYFLLIMKSNRTLKSSWSKYKIIGIVLFFAWFWAILEYFIQDEFIIFKPEERVFWFQDVILALFLTPLIFHYLIDGYIWKSKHFIARKIYGAQTP